MDIYNLLRKAKSRKEIDELLETAGVTDNEHGKQLLAGAMYHNAVSTKATLMDYIVDLLERQVHEHQERVGNNSALEQLFLLKDTLPMFFIPKTFPDRQFFRRLFDHNTKRILGSTPVSFRLESTKSNEVSIGLQIKLPKMKPFKYVLRFWNENGFGMWNMRRQNRESIDAKLGKLPSDYLDAFDKDSYRSHKVANIVGYIHSTLIDMWNPNPGYTETLCRKGADPCCFDCKRLKSTCGNLSCINKIKIIVPAGLEKYTKQDIL